LYWEPEKLGEKVNSFLMNTVELYFVLALCGFALYFSSAVAAAFFLVSFGLLATSLQTLKKRIIGGYLVLGLMAFLLLSDVIWKVRKNGTMATRTTDFTTFRREIAFYESLGF
jgi:hypothetical protein